MNTDLNPMDVDDMYWLVENKNKNISHELTDIGKWMLFCYKHEFNEQWQELRQLYRDNELTGVISMKCSTNKVNERASDTSKGVIILYCNNSDDEDYILNIGKNLIKVKDCSMFVSSKNPYIYYKTDLQTNNGTRATGQNKNYLYRLKVD